MAPLQVWQIDIIQYQHCSLCILKGMAHDIECKPYISPAAAVEGATGSFFHLKNHQQKDTGSYFP